MTNRLVAVAAFLVLAGFLGILVWEVPRLDLGAVIGVTLLLVLVDLLGQLRGGPR